MNTIYWIDAFVLNRFERYAHKIQRFCGINCFALARIVLWAGLALETFFLGAFALFMPLFTCLQMTFISRGIEARLQAHLPSGFKNPLGTLNAKIAPFRVLTLLIAIAFPIVTREPFYYLLVMAVSFYLLSCTPLPPAESKVKAFLRSLKPVPVPAPQPATG